MSSKLLSNGTVLAFDNATSKVKVLRRASVLVQGDRIAAITEDVDELTLPTDTEIIDVEGKIVSPGFVNTHIHSWQTAYRSIGPDVTLLHYFDWVSQNSKTSRAFTPDDVYISSLAGYMEGINGGVTTYVEHAHNNWSPEILERGFDAAMNGGARVFWCYDVFPRETFLPDQQWAALERLAAKSRPDELSLGLAFDGLGMMRTSAATLKDKISDERKLDIKVITAHHIGGPWPSTPFFLLSAGYVVADSCVEMKSPADFCAEGLHELGIPIILSHASYLTKDDIVALREHNLHISITPESEFHYGHCQTTGHLVSDQASLGIDTNWTFSGDILTQARLWLQSVRHTEYVKLLSEKESMAKNTPMTVEQGFLLATRQGGRALHRDDIGTLQVGAKADIVVFSGDSPNMVGWSNPIAAIMLHANVGDIEHVLVGGQFRKRDFRLVPKDGSWADIKAKFIDAAERVQAAAFPPPPVPEQLWGQGKSCEAEVLSTIRKA